MSESELLHLPGLGGREDRPLSPFVGREREMAALRDVLADVEAGRGQVVGLVGEVGAGKSRVVGSSGASADPG